MNDLARPAPAAPPVVARDWALFLDLDGTLLDIAARPDLVQAPRGLARCLTGLADALSGRLAVVSGRRVEVIERLLAPYRPAAAGLHGAEYRMHPGGALERVPAPSGLIEARRRFRAMAMRLPGTLLEDKGLCLALHFRTAPDLAEKVGAAVERFRRRLPPAFEVIGAKMAYELRPRGLHKGLAMQRFMALAGWRGARPVFVGDDRTDEDGFACARALGGIAIGVGIEPAGACFRLADPASVRNWLARSLEDLAEDR
ncbi:MAG: trehalose-phosphatase [Alphaproteobacteria bacterium]|nr:trehalose-phosphatase [Alphaproteobacteria bacterium]